MSDTITVVLRNRGNSATTEVQGRLVAPGLAITPHPNEGRYSLTHVGSGLGVILDRCAEHIEVAAAMAAAGDWTRAAAELTTDTAMKELATAIHIEIGWTCQRCGPKVEGPSWQVRCNTCDWQYDPQEDEPLTAKDAKNMARRHECEPQVEIAAPESKDWLWEFEVSNDGTVAERASRRRTETVPADAAHL